MSGAKVTLPSFGRGLQGRTSSADKRLDDLTSRFDTSTCYQRPAQLSSEYLRAKSQSHHDFHHQLFCRRLFGISAMFRLRKISQAPSLTSEMADKLTSPTRPPDAVGVPSPWALAGLGVQFAVALVAFVYGGSWLDQKFGSSPLGLLAGVVLGGGGTFYLSYRRLMQTTITKTDTATTMVSVDDNSTRR